MWYLCLHSSCQKDVEYNIEFAPEASTPKASLEFPTPRTALDGLTVKVNSVTALGAPTHRIT